MIDFSKKYNIANGTLPIDIDWTNTIDAVFEGDELAPYEIAEEMATDIEETIDSVSAMLKGYWPEGYDRTTLELQVINALILERGVRLNLPNLKGE